MSDKAAGWYPDPDGENRQRFWDGDSWSDYYAPLVTAPPEVHGAASATQDYPYLANARTAAHHEVVIPTGPAQRGWPTSGVPGGSADGETLEFSGGGKRSSAGLWAMVAASILVVMLVVGVGWWAIRGRVADPGGGGSATSTPPPSDGPTSTGTLALGDTTGGEVAEGGLWVGELTLDSDVVVVIDVRSTGGGDDPAIEVVAAGTDDVVASNDDRGSQLSRIGGSALNPLVVVPLDAGTYEVRTSERRGERLDFDASVTQVSTALTLDSPVSGSVPEDGGWFASLEVPSDGDYTIDVSTEGSGAGTADPVLVAFGPDGDRLVSDDRGQDEFDPLLQDDLVAGTWVLVVAEYYGDPVDITVTAGAG